MKREINAFLDYLKKERGFSDNTISAYQNDLIQLAEFLENEAKGPTPQWAKADQHLFLKYISELQHRGYAPATIARKVSATKSLFKFLASKGEVTKVPAVLLGSPEVRKNSPQSIPMEDVEELLRQPEKSSTPEAGRDKAMLELLYDTGMRVSEVIALNTEDVNFKKSCIRCHGAGSKRRSIELSPQVTRYLRHYVEEVRPQLARSNHKDPALFLNRLGQRLTRQGLWQILKNYAKAADIAGPISPRALRHTAAFHMLDKGQDLHKVQKQLGHASISTTQVYSQTESEESQVGAR
ncbi:MAG: tyrosine-type recombinase/integrase [Chloroflexota bacterium]|nr:tyrosine-type recombinase/integrase [Chloroflexota bacterium]